MAEGNGEAMDEMEEAGDVAGEDATEGVERRGVKGAGVEE